MKIKKILFLLFFAIFINQLNAQKKISDQEEINNTFNFILATDMGRNGYYEQKPIAELMGETAKEINAQFVVATGDIHHYLGVQSVNDPLWMSNFELVYSHPELQLQWFPVLGNHEYRGNTKAVIDYSKISRRWCMNERFYTQVYNLKDTKESLRIVYIDTTPLIDKYRNDSIKYPDAVKQEMGKQLFWMDSVLNVSSEKWKIVVGHHPIYAQTPKDETERLDMQKRVDPILKKYKVDMYICGHLHSFQHLRVPGSDIDYIVNSAASLSRVPEAIEGTQFCSPETGFSVCSATTTKLQLHMINNKAEVIYTITRNK